MRISLTIMVVFLSLSCLCADVIELNNGGIIVGKIVKRTDDYVVVITKGSVQTILSTERIKCIERGEPEEVYRRKLKEVKDEDADEHYNLGIWCERVRLNKYAREEFEKCLILEPNHIESRKKLGFKFEEGEWVREEKRHSEEAIERELTDAEKEMVKQLLSNVIRLSEMTGEEHNKAIEALKKALEVERKIRARISKEMLLCTGFTKNRMVETMLTRWHQRWERARLQVLKSLFLKDKEQNGFAMVERALEVYKYYAILLKRRIRLLKRIGRDFAREIVERIRNSDAKIKRLSSLLTGAKKGMTDVVSDDMNLKSAYAFLLYIAGLEEEGWKVMSEMDGWRLRLFLTLVSERILNSNRKVAKSFNEEEKKLSRLINGYRVALGRMPLELDGKLCKAAREHLVEMEKLGYFGHISPLCGTPKDRAHSVGYKSRLIGASLFRGGRAEDAMDVWRRSSPHHKQLLSGWDPLLLKDREKFLALVFMPWRSFGLACRKNIFVIFGPLSRLKGVFSFDVEPPSKRQR